MLGAFFGVILMVVESVGFIGLGLMGLPMAENLMRYIPELMIWNRTPEKAQSLLEQGACWASSPKALADCVDVVIMCLTDEMAIESVMFEDQGIVGANNLPRVIIDHSTIAPASAIQLSEKAMKLGITYIDAPVTGSVPGAINGTLNVFAGGDATVLSALQPVFDAYTARVTHMGASGFGQATKLCNQVMLHTNILAIFETLNLAKQQGLDIDILFDAFEGSLFDSKVWRIFSRAAIAEAPPKLAQIKDMMKDINYVKTTAAQKGSPTYLMNEVAKLVAHAMEKDQGYDDVVNIADMYQSSNT
jgi:2-hydroxy-3-oxopropionate reductase